ncbi:MAG: methylated-DNA--[protein]-cysteine S-methyltransferase [Candidatus Didemnitutus sp.]|nr:methylated-DNA--[protein]-cysteine S-methyltransferase [Candidatus Didemnitutus sp.]
MPHTLFPTNFGTCGIAWNDTGLTGFQLPEATAEETASALAARTFTKTAVDPRPEWLRHLIARVQQHLEGKSQDFTDAPLDWSRVTDFQKAVYVQTLAIKAGYKKSYGEVAKAMALGPAASRAVGTALAMNPWPLVVPCHRVVSADDKMTGFSGPGGVRTKTRLLALEGAELLSE